MSRTLYYWHSGVDGEPGDWRLDPPVRARRFGNAPMVIRDIQPYRNVAVDGRMITSRSQHREMLREHGMVEVGNERVKPPPKPKLPDVRPVLAGIMNGSIPVQQTEHGPIIPVD